MSGRLSVGVQADMVQVEAKSAYVNNNTVSEQPVEAGRKP